MIIKAKKTSLIILASLFFWLPILAQEEEDNEFKEIPEIETRTSEIKLNAFNVITFKTLDFSYEYILSSEASVGISLMLDLNSEDDIRNGDGAYYNESFAITPYYRHYFSRKYAYGFYIEGFMMYNTQPADRFYYYEDIEFLDKKSNNLAMGFAVGGKFLTRSGFVFDLYGGIGRNFLTSEEEIATEIVPRLGISFGYRF